MKYEIPKIKPQNFDIRDRMELCCNESCLELSKEMMCDGITCIDCLFYTFDVTVEQEEQFLEWEQQEAK